MGPIRGSGSATGNGLPTGNMVASLHALAAGLPFRAPRGGGAVSYPPRPGRQPVHDAASRSGVRGRGRGRAVVPAVPGGGDGGVSADADLSGPVLRTATGAGQRGETADPGAAGGPAAGGAAGVGRSRQRV